jgi:hypothetical protein
MRRDLGKNVHTYYSVGDFNSDGRKDFAVLLVMKGKDEVALAVFNAPFRNAVPALSYTVKAGDKARYCANPECPAPYFFVQRKNQRYCSEICAAPAQRELKRRWWAEYGDEWRAARSSKKSSKGRE